MRQFTTIIRHMVATNVRNWRIPIATALLLVLFGLSIATLVGDYRCNLDDYNSYISSDEPLLGLNRPSPLRIFGAALTPQLDAVYSTNSFHQIEMGSSDKSLNQSFALSEPLDSVYILKVIASLMAVFMSFDLVVRERERGTLTLCVVNAVSRRMWLLAKISGVIVSAALPVVIALSAGAASVALVADVHLTTSAAVRLVLFLFLSCLYIGAFACLGALVSTVSRSSSQSLVVLVGVWAAVVFCVPGLAANISSAASPAPQTQEVDRKMNALWAAGVFDLLAHAHNGHFTAEERARSNADILSDTRNLESSYFSSVDRQMAVYGAIGRVSPVSAYVDAASAILQEGVEDARNLNRQLRQLRDVAAKAGRGRDYSVAQLSLKESVSAGIPGVLQLAATALVLMLVSLIALERKSIS